MERIVLFLRKPVVSEKLHSVTGPLEPFAPLLDLGVEGCEQPRGTTLVPDRLVVIHETAVTVADQQVATVLVVD